MQPEAMLPLVVPVVFLLLLAIESRRAARTFEPVRGWAVTGSVFFAMVMAIGAMAPILLPVEWLATHHVFDLSGLGLAAIVPALLTTTFLLYWLHRAEHRYDWLWRATHQLHHSAPRVDMLGAYFAHPLEVVLKVSAGTAVSIYLLGLTPMAAAAAGVISALLSMFQHWNIRTPHWLGYLVPRPESHCLHHERDVHGRNYGDLPLWDMVFGTYANPRDDFRGQVGFGAFATGRIGDMLLMRDVTAGATPAGSIHSPPAPHRNCDEPRRHPHP